MMTSDFWALTVILIVLLLWFYYEAVSHEKNLRQIPLRIHVNGTRGKSSVTRLIAAGLREAGLTVVAKTTGTEPKIILPDGSERQIIRKGPPNIKELLGVVAQAAAVGADALVTECMAVRPELQWFAEHRLIKANIGVITNIRADHEDVMGNGLTNVARSLANTIPDKGVLVTVPQAKALLLTCTPVDKRQVIAVQQEIVKPGYLEGFPYEVVPENLAIALTVCQMAGVDAATALDGMRKSRPDAGNLTIRTIQLGKKEIVLINALAANDPESTMWLWHRYQPFVGETVILLNCRQDRRYRTRQLCEAMTAEHQGCYILAGDIDFARNQLLQNQIPSALIHKIPPNSGYAELAAVLQFVPATKITVFAAGNVQGMSNLMDGDIA